MPVSESLLLYTGPRWSKYTHEPEAFEADIGILIGVIGNIEEIMSLNVERKLLNSFFVGHPPA